MVNANKLNSQFACSPHAHFCKFFPFSPPFLRFKNPVKYSLGFFINGIYTPPPHRRLRFLPYYQIHTEPPPTFTLLQRLCDKLVQDR